MKSLLSWLVACIAWLATVQGTFAQSSDAIRAGDTVLIKIAGVPPSDMTSIGGPYPLSAGGNIALPYLNKEIRAQGLRFSDLARTIEAAYRTAGIFTNPRVTIVPNASEQGNVINRLVTVGGEVRSPGVVQWREGLTILDAIIEKGGFSDFAKSKEVRLMRGSSTTTHNLRNVTSDSSQNVKLQVNDRIIVPGGL